MTINDLAQYVTVFAALGGAMYWAVLDPLKNEINRLAEILTQVNRELEQSKEDRRHLSERVASLEQSDKSAHKRLQLVEDIVFADKK